MKYKKILILIIALISIIIPNISNAETTTTKNNIPIPIELSVNDLNKLFSKDEISKINTQLKELYDETKVKIAVVTIPAKYLEKVSGKDYSLKISKNWKKTNEPVIDGENNTESKLVFLIAGNKDDLKNRFVRFEVGDKLSSDVSQQEFDNIIKDYIVPELKKGNYFLAVTEGINGVKNLYPDPTIVAIVEFIMFILGVTSFIFFVRFVIKKLSKLKHSKTSSSSSSNRGFTTSFNTGSSYIYDTSLYNDLNYSSSVSDWSSDSDSSSDSSDSSDFSGSGSDSDW